MGNPPYVSTAYFERLLGHRRSKELLDTFDLMFEFQHPSTGKVWEPLEVERLEDAVARVLTEAKTIGMTGEIRLTHISVLPRELR